MVVTGTQGKVVLLAMALAVALGMAAICAQSAFADEADNTGTPTAADATDTGDAGTPDLATGEGDLGGNDPEPEPEPEPEPKPQPESEPEVAPSFTYAAHQQGKSWNKHVKAGKVIGSTAAKYTIDAFAVTFNSGTHKGSLKYRSHLAGKGWQDWKRDGATSGKIAKGAKLDAVTMKLTGELAAAYDIVYRVNAEGQGWLPWVSGGTRAGKAGGARIKAIQARLVERPEAPIAKPTVEDGLYELAVSDATTLRAAVKAGSTKAGANVQLATNAAYDLAQAWRVTWKGNGYEVMNVNSGRALDAPTAASNSLASAKQSRRTKSTTQRWAIERVKGGYQLVSMKAGTHLAVAKRTPKAGADLALALPDSNFPGTFKMKRASVLPTGTVRLFSKLGRTRLCAAMPDLSLASGDRPRLAKAGDAIGERFSVAAHDGYYTIQAAASGRYLTAKGGVVSQRARSGSRAQRWRAEVPDSGGVQLVNVATGKALAVKDVAKKTGTKLVLSKPNAKSLQSWFPSKAALLPAGLFEFRARTAQTLQLDVAGASLASGANAMLFTRNGGNNQKFIVKPEKGGYCRINMALGATSLTVAGASVKTGANVRSEKWRNASSQLWKPIVTDWGIAFTNKKSGKRLSFGAKSSGANVRQSSAKAQDQLSTWVLTKTSLNPRDELSYRNAIATTPGGGLKLSNAADYHVSSARWSQLVGALQSCWETGADVGFIMVDLDTGMTMSLDPDDVRFGASTVKGLYVTYLFQEYLERGRLSWGDVDDLIWPTIVRSNNATYASLRARFGNENEFSAWLGAAGVGYIGQYGNCSARTLAKAWTHMAAYAASGGSYVGTWKSLFDHSDHSFIHEALDGRCRTFSKPGWMEAGTWSGRIMNDAGIVEDGNGGRYLLAFTTTVDPDWGRGRLAAVVQALDAIHREMASSTAR